MQFSEDAPVIAEHDVHADEEDREKHPNARDDGDYNEDWQTDVLVLDHPDHVCFRAVSSS